MVADLRVPLGSNSRLKTYLLLYIFERHRTMDSEGTAPRTYQSRSTARKYQCGDNLKDADGRNLPDLHFMHFKHHLPAVSHRPKLIGFLSTITEAW